MLIIPHHPPFVQRFLNYGIKTGCNEAFIINTEKRDEILAECQTGEEKKRTAELIRPILRGRDIKRYGYDWENLWLINTHNGLKGEVPPIDVNQYPAIKRHLDNNWEKIHKRADKGDTPYNLRNCAYMEDFSKPKIIYPNMTKFLPFVLDDDKFLTNQKCFILTGEHLGFLTAFLNSTLFKYCFKECFPELLGGTRELSKIFFEKIPIIKVNNEISKKFSVLVNRIQESYSDSIAAEIDEELFKLYSLSEEEKKELRSLKYDEKA